MIQIIRKRADYQTFNESQLIDFLFKSLEKYGDPREQIQACFDYVFEKGGFIAVASEEDRILGVTVVNETGMSGYIPENILVYIAVDAAARGKGVGKALMEEALKAAKGDVALHVEPDNPAKFLYEKLGFENKYLEMRYKN
jgi:GNAT superfamily N-acetyltransferase